MSEQEAGGGDKGAQASRQDLSPQGPPGAFSRALTAATEHRHPLEAALLRMGAGGLGQRAQPQRGFNLLRPSLSHSTWEGKGP